MGTLTQKRGDYSLRNQGRGRFGRALTQATKACRQAFDRVDIDRTRNQIKHLPSEWKKDFDHRNRALLDNYRSGILGDALCYKAKLEKRRLEYYTYRIKSFLYLDAPVVEKPEHLPVMIPVERQVVRVTLCAALFIFAAGLFQPSLDESGTAHAYQTDHIQQINTLAAKPVGPKNWLDGIPEANGFRKDALSGPLKYAKDSNYEFAATEERLLEMVEEGTLIKLEETKSLKFNDVSRPYVLPMVAEFVYRLADQYNFGERCGPLVLNGAARDIAFQRTLGNGSEKSVHPAGMAVDFKSTGHSPRCQVWLEETFLEIEAARRIDYTKEVSEESPHYHVAVATHTYEAWLERRRNVADPDTDTLRTAMFYEGGQEETNEGYRAIGWTIRNRARSKDYPNTIEGVVADGSAGKHDGGCQFSFKCDGKPEDRYELCRTKSGELTSYYRHLCDMRWEKVTVIAKAVMAETNDPTGGATLYHATWMNPLPPWARSRKEKWPNGKTIELPYGDFAHKPLEIGNHFFGCSRFAGNDVPCEGVGS
jgi:spore germination cell wall hydrolase CwlJ-like protein